MASATAPLRISASAARASAPSGQSSRAPFAAPAAFAPRGVGMAAPSSSLSSYLGAKLVAAPAWSTASRPARRGAAVPMAAIKRTGKRSVVFQMTLVADEGKADDVLASCKELVQWVHGEAIADSKNGILEFDCGQDPFDSNQFHFWERYLSNSHMATFKQVAHKAKFEGWMQSARPLLSSPMKMVMYEYVNGQISSACVPIGPKGEGGLDDATGASGAAGGAGMQQTEFGSQLAKDELEAGKAVKGEEREKLFGIF